MPQTFEAFSQLDEVVNLAVGDDRDRLILVEQRLPAAGQVDDRQPPHGHEALVGLIATFAIGAAVNEGIAQDLQLALIRRAEIGAANQTYDSAHRLLS